MHWGLAGSVGTQGPAGSIGTTKSVGVSGAIRGHQGH